jgi:protein kinase-like protein/WD40 repeat protein
MIPPGTRLGFYEVLSPLGIGGMGEVLRARDLKLGREVALKILPQQFASDADRIARFQREAQVLASLNHPHIAAIYGFEEIDGVRALVLELVEGETLADRISRGPIRVDEAVAIARQIAEALEAAHEQGIVHRDLKPANIKVDPDGVVKVLDFGLAKLSEPPTSAAANASSLSMSPTITTPAMTQIGMILGTAAYMSPEQAKGRPADKRSDLWAFGCVLYEMLTGHRAFDGDDVTEVLGAVVRLEPNWQLLPADAPPAVRSLLQQCLVKDRKRRVADIAAARFVLDHQTTAIADAAPAARTEKRLWPRVAAFGVALLAVTAAGGALVWFLTRPDPLPVVRTTITTPPSMAVARSTVLGRVVALTPDGSRVVYESDNQLIVRPLDGEPKVLARGPFRSLFISPDSQWVGFVDRGVIKRIAITGGPIEPVVPVQGDLAGAAWGPDGTLVFATAAPNIGLQRVSPGGGTPSELTTLAPAERDHVLPEFLPDGEAVLFTIFPAVGGVDNTQIAVLDLRTGVSKRLIPGSDPHYVSSGHLVYTAGGALRAIGFNLQRRETYGQSALVLDGVATTRVGVAQAALSRDGSLVYIPGSVGARRTIVFINRDGKETPLPNLPPANYRQVRVSPDRTRFAASAGGDIRIYDFARGSVTALATDAATETNPLWARDQRRVFFTSTRSGFPQIYSQLADGTGEAELVLSRARDLTNLMASAWASDKRLVFAEVPNDLQVRLGLVDIDRPDAVTMLAIRGSRPSISQYGIAYESNASGQYEIYVERFPQLGNREKVGVGRDPRWSADGRELFFVSEDGREMFSAKVEPGPTPRFGQPQSVVSAGMIATEGGDSAYDVAREGFVVIRDERTGSGSGSNAEPTIELIQHWAEELKRLVPAD